MDFLRTGVQSGTSSENSEVKRKSAVEICYISESPQFFLIKGKKNAYYAANPFGGKYLMRI